MNIYYEKTSRKIPFIIRKFESKQTFSHFIFDTEKWIPGFSITGPYGLGLRLSSELKGHHYIFAAGTGILPFCDFLFFLLRFMTYHEVKNHIENQEKNMSIIKKHEVIGEGLEHVLINESFRLTIFLAFRNSYDFINLEIMKRLLEISQRDNDSPKINCTVNIKDIGIVLDPTMRFGQIKLTHQIFDDQYLESNLKDPEKLYICGSPAFEQQIYQGALKMNILSEKILVL